MKQIQLFNNGWYEITYQDYNINVRGWAEYKDNVLQSDMIAYYIKMDLLDKKGEFDDFTKSLNGNFSIIISGNQETYIISDRMRSFPIVYFFENKNLIVTDDILKYKQKNAVDFKINETTCEQFLCSNYIVGFYTLFNDVYSTQSGEIVKITHTTQSIDRAQYFQWVPYMQNDEFQRNYQDEARHQEKIFINVFERMIKSAPKVNNWIIPLSGGYDSRTIVNYLYKLGVKNVICFTYGMESNIQSEISKQVAEALGYEWYFIDYKVWIREMKIQNVMDVYLGYGFNGSSVPHLQDFPAVYALKEMDVLHENDIFVPGHALEVIAGNHMNINMKSCTDLDSVIPILKHHFSGFGYYSNKKVKVYKHLKSIISKYNIDVIQIAECFDWQERQTKFIANSVKVYEYFGYDSRIPEWDFELINYWDKIGFNHKLNRNMFKEVFKDYLTVDVLKPIPFANDLVEKQKINIKQFVIDNIPFTIKKILKKSGITPSFYHVNEGSHLIYADNRETIEDYLNSFDAPEIVVKYLKPYAKSQRIANFEINSMSTLLNIRKSIN